MTSLLVQMALFVSISPISTVTQPQTAPKIDYEALKGESIAILPIINLTGEKWEELREKLEDRLTKKLNEVFEERGFNVVKRFVVESAIDELKIDLTDEENHRKDILYSIGEKSTARLAVFVVLTNNTQRTKNNFFTSTPEGEVTVKYWLVDCKSKTSIFSAKSETAKARPKVIAGAKGSDQQLTAADRVIPAAFKDFLEEFPIKGK